jgi:hypothetical protein
MCLFALSAGVGANDEKKSSHIAMTAAELKWGPPPPVIQKEAQFAVVSGDPGKAEYFVIRLKMPKGYKIAPHWHPTDEHVTVLSGTAAIGMGDVFDMATMKELPPGGYALCQQGCIISRWRRRNRSFK